MGRPIKYSAIEVLIALPKEGLTSFKWYRLCRGKTGMTKMSRWTFNLKRAELLALGKVTFIENGKEQSYSSGIESHLYFPT
jgi:hypothetical protein